MFSSNQKMSFSVRNISYFSLIICFAIGLRAIISLNSYSGASTPPMYGDYEAQRHWQEICVNLPVSEWYTNSSRNDLLYWGLDYPPLTAYHSLCLGKIAKQLNPLYVQLYTSRGFESKEHLYFMRLSVLAADIIIYIPAILLAVTTIGSLQRRQEKLSTTLQHLAICMFYPGQILIDNGHFQYNNISLGLATLAVVALLRDHLILASISFSLALNYKQMELYHAVPFFVYLLHMCVREKTFTKKIWKLLQIGSSVLVTFTILWLPWLYSRKSFLAVVRRIFPISRGLFEDKVSNVWCAMNVIVKFKTMFTNEQMALICLIVTGLLLIPNALQLYINPSKQGFIYSLFNSAIVFFLFSFQVHEKSILLAALPAMMLFPCEPLMVTWFLQISTFSMFPLFEKDKLLLPFIAMWVMFKAFFQMISKMEPMMGEYNRLKWYYHISILMIEVLSLCQVFAPRPRNLPHIYELAISVYSCIHFMAFFCYTTFKQFRFNSKKKIN